MDRFDLLSDGASLVVLWNPETKAYQLECEQCNDKDLPRLVKVYIHGPNLDELISAAERHFQGVNHG